MNTFEREAFDNLLGKLTLRTSDLNDHGFHDAEIEQLEWVIGLLKQLRGVIAGRNIETSAAAERERCRKLVAEVIRAGELRALDQDELIDLHEAISSGRDPATFKLKAD